MSGRYVDFVPEMSIMGEWMTIREAAEELGVSETTIRRRMQAGTLTGRQEAYGQGFRWQVWMETAADAAPSAPPVSLAPRYDAPAPPPQPAALPAPRRRPAPAEAQNFVLPAPAPPYAASPLHTAPPPRYAPVAAAASAEMGVSMVPPKPAMPRLEAAMALPASAPPAPTWWSYEPAPAVAAPYADHDGYAARPPASGPARPQAPGTVATAMLSQAPTVEAERSGGNWLLLLSLVAIVGVSALTALTR